MCSRTRGGLHRWRDSTVHPERTHAGQTPELHLAAGRDQRRSVRRPDVLNVADYARDPGGLTEVREIARGQAWVPLVLGLVRLERSAATRSSCAEQ
jgi:hypothetical protein